MRNAIVALVLVALVPAFVFGATTSNKTPEVKYPLITGDEEKHFQGGVIPSPFAEEIRRKNISEIHVYF